MKILIFFIVIAISLGSCIRIDTGKNEIKKRNYRGSIKDIYQDDLNHMAWTFVVQTKTSNFEIIANVWPRSWEYAKIGDSIIKPADTLMIIIKKNDSTKMGFFYKF